MPRSYGEEACRVAAMFEISSDPKMCLCTSYKMYARPQMGAIHFRRVAVQKLTIQGGEFVREA